MGNSIELKNVMAINVFCLSLNSSKENAIFVGEI